MLAGSGQVLPGMRFSSLGSRHSRRGRSRTCISKGDHVKHTEVVDWRVWKAAQIAADGPGTRKGCRGPLGVVGGGKSSLTVLAITRVLRLYVSAHCREAGKSQAYSVRIALRYSAVNPAYGIRGLP